MNAYLNYLISCIIVPKSFAAIVNEYSIREEEEEGSIYKFRQLIFKTFSKQQTKEAI